MKKIIILLLSFIYLAGSPLLGSNLWAIELNVDRDSIETGIIRDDYLFLGEYLDFSGQTEDLVFLGKILRFQGKALLGVFAVGETITIQGDVGNGIISAGKTITLDGYIKGTTYLAASKIRMTPDTILDGDLFLAAGDISVQGKINGDVYIASGKVEIENEISGNVCARTGKIRILGQGSINGNLIYAAQKELTDEESARITGETEFDKYDEDRKPRWLGKIFSWQNGLMLKAFLLLSFIISGLLLLFLPASQILEIERSPQEIWYTSLWGLIPLLMYPVIIILALLLVVTIPFAVILLLLGLPIFFFTRVLGATLLGQYLVTVLNLNIQKRHGYFLVGAAVYAIISFIPYFSFLGLIFLWSLGWGMIVSIAFRKKLI